jgi:hypothetical protein
MLGLLNTVLTRGGSLLTYVKEGLVMANRFLTPPKLTFPAQGSAEFDGASDYIQLDNAFSHTNHTIAAWVYANDTATWRTIYSANDSAATDGIRVAIQNDDQINYQINNVSKSSPLNQNEWVYFTGSYDGSTLKLYLDGSLIGSQSTSQSVDVSTNARIGQLSYNGEYYNGNLANVAIWNRALSSDEINSVMWKSYEALSGAESNGLKAWYSLDDITSPAASLANMEQLAADKDATIENKAAITAAINALS